MQVIIYRQEDGLIAVMTPAPEYQDQIEAVAQKDVPAGAPYRIVDSATLPLDKPRAEWDIEI